RRHTRWPRDWSSDVCSSDLYQVILEVADDQRSGPQDLHLLYIKSDDGSRMVPLNALATWRPILGPQSVNHINQFTSATLFFNLRSEERRVGKEIRPQI